MYKVCTVCQYAQYSIRSAHNKQCKNLTALVVKIHYPSSFFIGALKNPSVETIKRTFLRFPYLLYTSSSQQADILLPIEKWRAAGVMSSLYRSF